MGLLIPLSVSSGPTRRAPPPGETAAILFFTGVRYHRMPGAADPEIATPAPSAKVNKAAKVAKAPRLDCHI